MYVATGVPALHHLTQLDLTGRGPMHFVHHQQQAGHPANQGAQFIGGAVALVFGFFDQRGGAVVDAVQNDFLGVDHQHQTRESGLAQVWQHPYGVKALNAAQAGQDAGFFSRGNEHAKVLRKALVTRMQLAQIKIQVHDGRHEPGLARAHGQAEHIVGVLPAIEKIIRERGIVGLVGVFFEPIFELRMLPLTQLIPGMRARLAGKHIAGNLRHAAARAVVAGRLGESAFHPELGKRLVASLQH